MPDGEREKKKINGTGSREELVLKKSLVVVREIIEKKWYKLDVMSKHASGKVQFPFCSLPAQMKKKGCDGKTPGTVTC